MDNIEDIEAAAERLNAGALVGEVPPILIERMWEAISRIPSEKRQPSAGLYVCALLDPGLVPSNPEQTLAMMVRYAVLNALIDAGILDEYIKDETLRKKVFTAAALLPCDQSDLVEAVAERQKKKDKLTQASYAPDRMKVADTFLAWMNNRVD